MKKTNLLNKSMTIATRVAVTAMFGLALLLLAALLVLPTKQAAETEAQAVLTPFEIEEFNRQHCQLELDTDNTLNIYCKGE